MIKTRTIAKSAIALVALLPPVMLLWFSFTSNWPWPHILPSGFDTSGWAYILDGGGLFGAAITSATIAVPVAALSTGLGFITARFIARSRHKDRWMIWAILPFAMSPVILSLCLLYLFIALGLVGTALGVVLAQMMGAFAYATIFFTAFWSANARNLEDLVYSLGGNTWQALRLVLIPAAKGPIVFCLFQTFLLSWFQYGLPLVIGAGKVETLPVKLFSYLGEASPHFAAMASILLILPPIALLIINRRYLFEERTHVA